MRELVAAHRGGLLVDQLDQRRAEATESLDAQLSHNVTETLRLGVIARQSRHLAPPSEGVSEGVERALTSARLTAAHQLVLLRRAFKA